VEKPQSWHVRAILHIEEKRHIVHDHKIDVILAATTQSPKNIIVNFIASVESIQVLLMP
jgi:hypothetical protein